MPQISNKGILMPESPIRKLVPFAESAKKRGIKVYQLNIGQPDIETPKVALDAVKNNKIEVLAYSRSEGSEQYRTKLSSYYDSKNITVGAKDIIVTSGASEALLFTFGSIMDKDDEIIVPEPFYANYNGFSIANSLKIVPVISKIENNFSLPEIEDFEKLITKKTKAIVFVNYGGILNNLDKLNKIAKKNKIILIQDAAQSLGARYKKKSISKYADFTIFSFQAIKHITSGDGGLLVFRKNQKILSLAQRLRWFGIDRVKKQGGTWENDIKEIGYKYQMTDMGACLLIDSLKNFKSILNHRKKLFDIYKSKLSKLKNLRVLDTLDKNLTNSYWLCTVLCEKRLLLQKELRKFNIETNQVHFRNDRYKIFKKFIKKQKFPNMDSIQNKYLVLPLNYKISVKDAYFISNKIIQILKYI